MNTHVGTALSKLMIIKLFHVVSKGGLFVQMQSVDFDVDCSQFITSYRVYTVLHFTTVTASKAKKKRLFLMILYLIVYNFPMSFVLVSKNTDPHEFRCYRSHWGFPHDNSFQTDGPFEQTQNTHRTVTSPNRGLFSECFRLWQE